MIHFVARFAFMFNVKFLGEKLRKQRLKDIKLQLHSVHLLLVLLHFFFYYTFFISSFHFKLLKVHFTMQNVKDSSPFFIFYSSSKFPIEVGEWLLILPRHASHTAVFAKPLWHIAWASSSLMLLIPFLP